MIRTLLKVGVLAVVLLAAPAYAESLKDAYLDVKKSAFKKQYKQLAMMPLVSAPAVALPEAMKQLIIDDVTEKFTKSKFELLPVSEVKAIQDKLKDLYPANAPQESISAIAEHTLRELFFRHPVDGIINVQVLAVAAPFAKDKAQWGGTSQKIKHRGDGLFGAILGKDYGGYVAASAIRVLISDRSGKPVYNWSGGIEVMMQRNGQKFEELPVENLWQNEKRVRKAVKYALKPI